MMPYGTGGRLDQIVFAWSEDSLTGTRGIGPVAASLPVEELQRWTGRLKGAAWAVQETPGGQSGFSYLVYEDVAAVLRKWPVHDEGGRPGSTWTHVLTGPARLLTTDLALLLAGWDGWLKPEAASPRSRQMSALEAGRLVGERLSAADRADTANDTVQVLTRILADPQSAVIVTGAQAPTIHVTRAVIEILEAIGDFGQPWTFATRESGASVPAGARIVFLLEDPESPGYPSRRSAHTRIEIRPDGPDPHLLTTALSQMLVHAWVSEGRAVPPGLRAVNRLDSADAVARWAQSVQLAPGVLRDDQRLLRGAIRGGLSPHELAFVQEEAGRKGENLFRQIVGALDAKQLRDLLEDQVNGSRNAHLVLEVYRLLVAEAVHRVLVDPYAHALAAVVATIGVQEPEVETALQAALRGERGTTPQERVLTRVHAVTRALDLLTGRPRPGGYLEQQLSTIQIPELLHLAEASPDRAGSLIRLLTSLGGHPPLRPADQAVTATLLQRNAYFQAAVQREFDRERTQIEVLATLLRLAHGEAIAVDPYQVEAIISHFPERWPRLALLTLGLNLPEGHALWHVQRMLGVGELDRLERQPGLSVTPMIRPAAETRPEGVPPASPPGPPLPSHDRDDRSAYWQTITLYVFVTAFTVLTLVFFAYLSGGNR
jgi:hypothetical protein